MSSLRPSEDQLRDQDGNGGQCEGSWDEDDLATPPPLPPPMPPLTRMHQPQDESKGSESMEISSVVSPSSEGTSHDNSSSTEGLNESGKPLIQFTSRLVTFYWCVTFF